MDLSMYIDQVDARQITVDYFQRDYLAPARPLILKNFADLVPAGKLWTFNYLKDKIGNKTVGVFDNTKKSNTAYVKPDLQMPFSEFLDIIQRDEETPYRIFLFNMFKEFPELRKEFPTPAIARGVLENIGFSFFGGKNTHVRFHYDIDCSNVLMTQLIGRKRVILIPPDNSKLIYKVPFSSFSLIEPHRPDYRKYPALQYVKGYDFTLYPGDALFMPSRYWHFNTYLEGGMAVSYRIMAQNLQDVYNGFMNTTLRLAFDKCMNVIMGNSWMEKKKAMAFKNAAKQVRKIQSQQNRAIPTRDMLFDTGQANN